VSLGNAYGFLGLQLFIGFLVWMALPGDAKIVALLSLPLVAAYPFMKRLTWWPQAWLGATFNWGVLVGAATAATINLPSIVLYVGLALWTVAYDTIYALQDREDDAMMGVKSTARLFGDRAVLGALCFHLGAAALIAVAAATNGAGRTGALTALAFLLHGLWQTFRLKVTNEQNALGVFKSNVWAGGIIALGFLIAAMAPERKQSTLYADEEIVQGNRADTYDLPWFDLRVSKEDPRRKTWFATDTRRALELEGIPVPEPRGGEQAAPDAGRRRR
jgi:4-hydroxybenzoate polyprenyltransferase